MTLNWLKPTNFFKFQLKLNLPKDTSMIGLAALVGVINGFILVLYHYLIDAVNIFFFETIRLNLPDFLQDIFQILIPSLGGLFIAILFLKIVRYEKEYGAPAIMDAVVNHGGFMPKTLPIITFVASIMCIATGGSVGKEGPSILIGAGIASYIGTRLRLGDDKVRLLVGAGAATGLAATFNVPIAGSIFALEIIMADFSIRAFSPVIIASVFATTISRMYVHNGPLFDITGYSLVSPLELPLYLLLGTIGGFLSVGIIKSHSFFHDFFKNRLNIQEFYKPIIGGLIVGIMGFYFGETYGYDDSVINRILNGGYEIHIVFLLFFIKLYAMNITLASGGIGGLFTPTLIIGALYGLLFGILINMIFPDFTAPAGAYAMVGMAVMTAGVQHAMLSAIMIIFESTTNYEIMLPLMIGVVPAITISRFLNQESIYTMQFKFWGDRIARGRNVEILEKMDINSIITDDFETIQESVPMLSIIDKFMNTKYSTFPVLNSEDEIVGIISIRDIREVMFDEALHPLLIAHDFATRDIITLEEDSNFEDAFSKFDFGDFDSLPVVYRNTRKIKGIVSKEDLIKVYRKELLFSSHV